MSTKTKRRTTRRKKTKAKSSLRYAVGFAVLCAALVALCFALHRTYDVYVRAMFELEHYDTVMDACEDFDISPSLVYGIIRTESGFDEKAHSHADAQGLMQMTETALEWCQMRNDEFDRYTVSDLYDPKVNIRCGVYTLHLLFEQFDSEQAVIAAYNAGIGNVQEWLADPSYSDDGVTLHTIPFEETRNYVDRVQSSKGIYEQYYHLDDKMKGDETA
ncbi:MAG: lytic transglycosylase domain-containing protein [Clostridia bacterium]|nr:lytic transglycosylase domain-containing protein [Clostridia bacterium]